MKHLVTKEDIQGINKGVEALGQRLKDVEQQITGLQNSLVVAQTKLDEIKDKLATSAK